MGVVSMKQLLEAGVHFGHQTRRWNPKMAPYIFTERNGIYIIDLQKTVKKLDEAYMFVRDLAAQGESVLFVGTKKQAGDSIKEEAQRAGAYLCKCTLAGRYDDQLHHHSEKNQNDWNSCTKWKQMVHSICCRRRKSASSSSKSKSSKSSWAVSRT